MKKPRRPSCRQLMLLIDCETKIPLDRKAREDVIKTLADLLLEAIAAQPGTTGGQGRNESKD